MAAPHIFYQVSIFFVLLLKGCLCQNLFFNKTSYVEVPSFDILQGFQLSFRTCHGGTLFRQNGTNSGYIELYVTAGSMNSGNFTASELFLKWKTTHTEMLVRVGTELDQNKPYDIEYNNSTLSVHLGNVQDSVSVSPLINNFRGVGNILLGLGFIGCIDLGSSFDLTNKIKEVGTKNGCPLDSQQCKKTECKPGFKGYYCEINIDDCVTSKCHHASTCKDGIENYTCVCGIAWQGQYCDQLKPDKLCDLKPCFHNGVCTHISDFNNYTCTCPEPYSGRNCTEIIDPCHNSPCKNSGTCKNITSTYFECKCMPGFSGKTCEINIDDCAKADCGKGVCQDLISGYTCNCNGTGFNGQHCENDVNECVVQTPCFNGTCINFPGGYKCSCYGGFDGENCERDINECASQPCKNGGNCIDLINNYKCQCPIEYSGKNCESKLHGCNIDKSLTACFHTPCIHGQCKSTCFLYNMTYSCTCDHGYQGVNCSEDIDECIDMKVYCENNSTCENTDGDYHCQCDENYVGKFCNESRGICHPNPCQHGRCTNITESTYNCTCYDGWRGFNCTQDINECEEKIDKCNKSQSVSCDNTMGGYTCKCDPKFTGDFCDKDLNECEVLKPCLNNGVCKNSNGDYSCFCSGYHGKNCDIKTKYCAQAATDVCHNGTCVEENLNFACSCFEGWQGQRCLSDINECQLGYCKNNATCDNTLGNYTCTCPAGYADRNCSTDIDDCLSNPCENGGTCSDRVNDFHCNCTMGFSGKRCETDIDWCEVARNNNTQPCIYGVCRDQILNYTCQCYDGYIGVHCATDVDECASLPCENGATCVQKSNDTAVIQYYGKDEVYQRNMSAGYLCNCRPGFNGSNCELDIDECKLYKPCNETGTLRCNHFINDYNCTCSPGFTGRNCSIDIDECASKPCLNDGRCLNLVARFQCICGANYTGARCGNELDPCMLRQPCKNGGTCLLHSDNINYTCSCADGYDGETCTNKTTITFNGNSVMVVTTTQEQMHIQFSFQTIFSDGALISRTSPNWLLALKQGSLVMFWQGHQLLSVGKTLQDTRWHGVRLSITKDSISVGITNKTCVGECEATVAHPHTLASALSTGIQLSVGDSYSGSDVAGFTGSIRDFTINDKIQYPGVDGVSQSNVILDFQRYPVCLPDPCVNGVCHDKWSFYTCECSRNWTGINCTQEVHWATFGTVAQLNNGYKSTNNESHVSYNLSRANFKSVAFSLKTKSPDSVLALLYSNNSHYLSFETKSGTLQLTFSGKVINFEEKVLRTIADAREHLIEYNNGRIVVDGVSHQLSLSLVTFEKVFIGGLPLSLGILEDRKQFKGCIRDFRVSGEQLLFFGQSSHLNVTQINVDKGCHGEDVCMKLSGSNPCANNGNCSDLWNEYQCACPWPYGGDTCDQYGCEWINLCPNNATCLNVDGAAQFECLSHATFNGSLSSAILTKPLLPLTTQSLVMQFRTRQRNTSLMVTRADNGTFFQVLITEAKVVISYNLTGNLTGVIPTDVLVSDGEWREVKIESNSSNTVVTLYKVDISTSMTYSSQKSFVKNVSILNNVFTNLIALYGVRFGQATTTKEYLTGCLGMVRIAGHLVSFLPGNLTVDTKSGFDLAPQIFTERTVENVTMGCHGNPVCTNTVCGVGECVDLWNDFSCRCPTGYYGERCENNPCTSSPCSHGNCKVAGPGYECACAPGYVGTRCNESCTSGYCKNDGDCSTTNGKLECVCGAGWTGEFCEEAKPRDDDDDNLPLIIGLSVAGGILLLIIIAIICCCTRQTSSTFGTYSPRNEEKFGAQVEMNTVMNVPPPEKLI